MKKLLAILLTAVISLSFAACGEKNNTDGNIPQSTTKQSTNAEKTTTEKTTDKETTKEEFDYSLIPDKMTSENGKYEIAFVTDVGQLFDKGFNQETWEGVKRFAKEKDMTYRYYQPSNGSQATDDDRYDAIKSAADSGARVVVCVGALQLQAVKRSAEEYKDVKFIFVDGDVANGKDDEGYDIPGNVAVIDFNEEQSGFLAGYAAVADGYSKLGFVGGGAETNPSCNRYAYGYVQGAEAAAEKLNKNIEMKLSWEYGATFAPSAELQTMLSGWYENGTEIIFCCGGPMCQSAFAAASANEAAVIGVDVDQSAESDTVVTSAMKGLREAVMQTLSKAYTGKWNEIGGKKTTFGVEEDAVGLPTETWSMEKFTVEEYRKLYNALKSGEIKVDRDYENLRAESFEYVKLDIV